METEPIKTKSLLHSLLKPKVIILGFASFHVLSVAVYVWREWQTGGDQADVHIFMIRPIILLVASLGLWHSKWWSYMVSFCLSAWLAYVMAYSGLSAIASDIGKSIFSVSVLAAWWHNLFGEWKVYGDQPRFTFQLFLFTIIACYCVASMSHLLFRHLREKSNGV